MVATFHCECLLFVKAYKNICKFRIASLVIGRIKREIFKCPGIEKESYTAFFFDLYVISTITKRKF